MSTTPNNDHGTTHKSGAAPEKSNTGAAAMPSKGPVSGHDVGKTPPPAQGGKPQDGHKSADHR